MGSWGHRSFDNDMALDMLADLQDGGPARLREALSTVAETGPDQYLDVDDGNAVVASAEIVAAVLGAGRERLPEEVRRWLAAHPTAFKPTDLALARRALERILAPNSELVGLWDDYGFETEWHAGMRRLMARLGGDPAAAGFAARGLIEEHREPLSEEDRRLWEESLMTVLVSVRGFQPTEAQLARIRASRDSKDYQLWDQRASGDAASVDEVLDGRKD